MILSGENFILTPRTPDLSFVFEDFSIDAPGEAEIGFSGEGSKFFFLISGGRILDPSNNFVHTCNPDEPMSISGDFNGSKYRYYIDGRMTSDGKSKPNFAVEKFYVKTTNCQLDMNLQMVCPELHHAITFDEFFMAGGIVNGEVNNYSHMGFTVLESEITQRGYVENFTGMVTGVVPAEDSLKFQLYDISETTSFSDADATLKLRTTIGNIEQAVTSTRTSGFFRNAIDLSMSPDATSAIVPFFSGSGNYEKFTWTNYPEQEQSYIVGYSLLDEDGTEVEKPLYVSLENVSPTDQSLLTGQYLYKYFTYDSGSHYCTGEGTVCSDSQYTTKLACTGAAETWGPIDICAGEINGSGSYSGVPNVEFLTYSNVTGVILNSGNIFSSDTPYKIPMVFSGYEGELGAGASGYFLTQPFQVNIGTAYGGDGVNWKKITGYEMTNFGTGYTRMPHVYCTTGIKSTIAEQHGLVGGTRGYTTATDPNGVGTGYDLAYTEDVYVYQKFRAFPQGDYLAAYLTGVPYFVNTGNNTYGLSGILMTNPGSGYDPSLFPPTIKITRNSDDPLGTRGSCSDSQYTTQVTCEGAGTCSDTQWTSKTDCEGGGTCSDSTYNNNQVACEAYGNSWTSANNTWTAAPKVWTDAGDNLSGEFFWNKEGTTYDFYKAWNLETGLFYLGEKVGIDFREANLTSNNKYVSMNWLPPEDEQFYVTVKFNNLGIDEPMEAKLVISGSGDTTEASISITNRISEYTGMGWLPPNVSVSSEGTQFITSYFGG